MANQRRWDVEFYPEFEPEFDDLPEEVQDELLAKALLLAEFGPGLGRPHVDTLKGSRHHNLKELRFEALDGVWRVAFAFDPVRKAILLVAGDTAVFPRMRYSAKPGNPRKSSIRQIKLYSVAVKKADERFDRHLKDLKERQR